MATRQLDGRDPLTSHWSVSLKLSIPPIRLVSPALDLACLGPLNSYFQSRSKQPLRTLSAFSCHQHLHNYHQHFLKAHPGNRAIWNGDYRRCRSWRHLNAPTGATIGSASHLSSEPNGCPSSTLLRTQIVVALRSPSPLTVPSSADARIWPPKTEAEMLVARS
ncbi:hypothetical protein RB213_002157 [Colletotrichum asianum]